MSSYFTPSSPVNAGSGFSLSLWFLDKTENGLIDTPIIVGTEGTSGIKLSNKSIIISGYAGANEISIPYEPSELYNLSIFHDGSTLSAYLNGSLKQEASGASGGTIITAILSSTKPFRGLLGDIAFWGDSQESISDNFYNGGLVASFDAYNPLHYWRIGIKQEGLVSDRVIDEGLDGTKHLDIVNKSYTYTQYASVAKKSWRRSKKFREGAELFKKSLDGTREKLKPILVSKSDSSDPITDGLGEYKPEIFRTYNKKPIWSKFYVNLVSKDFLGKSVIRFNSEIKKWEIVSNVSGSPVQLSKSEESSELPIFSGSSYTNSYQLQYGERTDTDKDGVEDIIDFDPNDPGILVNPDVELILTESEFDAMSTTQLSELTVVDGSPVAGENEPSVGSVVAIHEILEDWNNMDDPYSRGSIVDYGLVTEIVDDQFPVSHNQAAYTGKQPGSYAGTYAYWSNRFKVKLKSTGTIYFPEHMDFSQGWEWDILS